MRQRHVGADMRQEQLLVLVFGLARGEDPDLEGILLHHLDDTLALQPLEHDGHSRQILPR